MTCINQTRAVALKQLNKLSFDLGFKNTYHELYLNIRRLRLMLVTFKHITKTSYLIQLC